MLGTRKEPCSRFVSEFELNFVLLLLQSEKMPAVPCPPKQVEKAVVVVGAPLQLELDPVVVFVVFAGSTTSCLRYASATSPAVVVADPVLYGGGFFFLYLYYAVQDKF